MILLDVFVPGKAETKGSAKAFHRPGMRFAVVVNDNVKAKTWQSTVAIFAASARTQNFPMMEGPVRVALDFTFARPKGHTGKRGLLPSAPTAHTQKPDIDKVIRPVLDGLTRVVYADDSQVVSVVASKAWGDEAGVRVVVMSAKETA